MIVHWRRSAFAKALSGQDIPSLFEHLLGKTDRTSQTLPKVYRRLWDNTYWWADAVCSRTLGPYCGFDSS